MHGTLERVWCHAISGLCRWREPRYRMDGWMFIAELDLVPWLHHVTEATYIKQNLVSCTSVENEFGWRWWCLNLLFFFPLAVKRLI